jgi:hypothetical protein
VRPRRWINLLADLKYALLFVVLELYLPLTVFPSMPGASLLGGIFGGLDAPRVFWASALFFSAAWSVMFCAGLLIDCRQATSPPGEAESGGPDRAMPASAVAFLALPVTRGQFLAFTGLGAYGALVTAAATVPATWGHRLTACGAALGGGVLAYLAMVVLLIPARLAVPEYRPVWESAVARAVWRLAGSIPGVAALARAWLSLTSAIARRLQLRYVLEDGHLTFPHFFAATAWLGIYLASQVVAWVFYPPDPRLGFGGSLAAFKPSAATYLYLLILLLTWSLSGLDCHLSRFRISPVVALLAVMVAVYGLIRTDHFFRVEAPPAELGVDPVEALAERPEKRGLVIVASSGGGILAAGWTTLALERLTASEPELAEQIGLLSTISGGSVGAAFYLAEALEAGHPGNPAALERAYHESIASSLASAAYGFALIDFWRIFGGPIFRRDTDRGILLQEAWRQSFENAGPNRHGEILLSDLRGPIAAGKLPAVIMSATSMETGRRVMLTPLALPGVGRELPTRLTSRGMRPECPPHPDLYLWTAARLSSTFAWVSPAARARGGGCGPGVDSQHLIDGGYFDNYGVASALDWLDVVLDCRWRSSDNSSLPAGAERCHEHLSFDRVAIVRLNAFAWKDPAEVPGDDGAVSALLGPVLGLAAIRTGVATSRNEIDLHRLLGVWNDRFAGAGMDVCLDQVELRPFLDTLPEDRRGPCSEAPLSWHLTALQKECQRDLWDSGVRSDHSGHIGQQIRALERHLSSPTCGSGTPALSGS